MNTKLKSSDKRKYNAREAVGINYGLTTTFLTWPSCCPKSL